MLCVQIVIRLGLTRESKKVTAEEKIKEILFNMSKEFKIHKIDSNNMILEIDYDKYTKQILEIFKD